MQKKLYFNFIMVVCIIFICRATPVMANSSVDLSVDSTNSVKTGDVNIAGDTLANDFSANMDQGQSNFNYLDFSNKGEISKNLVSLGGRLSLESFQPPRVIFNPEVNARKIWYEQPAFDQEELMTRDQVNSWLAQGFEIIQMDPILPRKTTLHKRPVRTMDHLPKTGKRLWGWMIQTPVNPYLYIGVKVAVSGAFDVSNTDTVVVIVRELTYGENAGNYFKPGGNAGGIENVIAWGASAVGQTGKGSAMAYPVYHIEVTAYAGVDDAEIYTATNAQGRMDIAYADYTPTQKPTQTATTNTLIKARFIGFSNGHLSLSSSTQDQAIAYNVALLQKNWNMINHVQFVGEGVDTNYAEEVRLETGARLLAAGVPEAELMNKFAPDSSRAPTPQLQSELQKRQLTGVVGVYIQ